MSKFLYLAIIYCIYLKIVSSLQYQKTFTSIVIESHVNQDATFDTSLSKYKNLLIKNKNITADIIVFPEYGFTGIQTKNLEKFAIQIDQKDITTNKNLTALRDLAKKYSCVIVANFLEKDGEDFFSTTIALNGTSNTLLAKYRKLNLNKNEYGLTAGTKSVTFYTNKLGTVGLLSGDDILYKKPTDSLIKNKNLTTIVSTSAFKSETPFKVALSIQQGYAQAYKINLLVSNLNDPINGYGGIGIYSGISQAVEFITGDNTTNILNQTLPLYTNPNSIVSFSQKKQERKSLQVKILGGNISGFKLQYKNDTKLKVQDLLNNTPANGTEICDGKFCCTFIIQTDIYTRNNPYRIVVKGGNDRICAILTCDDEKKYCGTPNPVNFTHPPIFTFIVISTINRDGKNYRPYILYNDLTTHTENNQNLNFLQSNIVSMFYEVPPIENLVVFGFISEKSGATSLNLFMGMQLIVFVVFMNYFF